MVIKSPLDLINLYSTLDKSLRSVNIDSVLLYPILGLINLELINY